MPPRYACLLVLVALPVTALAEPKVLSDLRAARFDKVLKQPRDPRDSRTAAAQAIARYITSMHALVLELGAVVESGDRGKGLDHARMRKALSDTEAALASVDADLALVAADPAFALELCLACWKRDWNRSGKVDPRDERLLEIEIDAAGNDLPEADPRRRPVFRFDVGDAHWARAMVSFQRAVLQLLLAYSWTDLDNVLTGRDVTSFTLHLTDRARVTRARELILAALAAADLSRQAYLAEVDDDREWVPSPKQKNHPIPLPADDQLYRTWADVTADLRRLVAGEEGLSVAELAQLGDHRWKTPPGGYLDFGRMFSSPADIVLDFATLQKVDIDDAASVETALRSVLGAAYAPKMPPSPLIKRLERMKSELDRGEDTLSRKLRYLLWLN